MLHADREPGEWLTNGRDIGGSFYSPLGQINAANVSRLGFAWQYQLGTRRGLEATPLVIDGVMYTSGDWGRVYALDAATGNQIWTYDPHVDGQYGRNAPSDVVNRGVAMRAGRVYVGSLDGYLHALDARTGALIWKVDTLPARGPKAFPYVITGAPLLAGHLVVIGCGGGDLAGARGFITAFDADTGAFKWRFYTVPADPRLGKQPGYLERAVSTWSKDYDWSVGGGGSVWDGMAYDPALGLIYIGTGNAAPYKVVDTKHGESNEKLYTASIMAVKAATGEFAWYFQEVPGDAWDYDAAQKMILADIRLNGRVRHVLMQASKDGFFYILDRASGELISATPFASTTWARGLDPTTHLPIRTADSDWTRSPKLITPGAQGAHNWQPMSFSPRTGLVYIPVIEAPMIYINTADRPAGYMEYQFDTAFLYPEDYDPDSLRQLFGPLPSLQSLAKETGVVPRSRGFLRAFDPVQGRVVWEVPGFSMWDGGVLSTGGDLVVRGDAAGKLNVYAADSGRLLKTVEVGTAMMAAPMTYRVGSEQYIAVMAGYGGGLLFEPYPPGSAPQKYDNAGRIVAFKLDGGPVPSPAPALPLNEPEPPSSYSASPASVERGAILYNRYCARCHVFGRGLLPDLRRLDLASQSMFDQIVLHGLYSGQGMARWDDVLTTSDAHDIRAYLIESARALKAEPHASEQ